MEQGRKALFAAPMRPLPAEGTVTLRLRRGHAFSPDVTMTTTWLQEKRHVAASAQADTPTSESPAAVRPTVRRSSKFADEYHLDVYTLQSCPCKRPGDVNLGGQRA